MSKYDKLTTEQLQKMYEICGGNKSFTFNREGLIYCLSLFESRNKPVVGGKIFPLTVMRSPYFDRSGLAGVWTQDYFIYNAWFFKTLELDTFNYYMSLN